ncbi:hypothetical protein J7M23_05425 [Candidatus Sumerlaeota bacterium]|nr:hypothetical protein [Candidatus Sumerlaeota bacterium]
MNTGLIVYLPGGLMILVFLVVMVMMYLRKMSALIALPVMALTFSLIGIVRYGDFLSALVKYLSWAGFLSLAHWSVIAFILMGVVFVLARMKILTVKVAIWTTLIIFVVDFIINFHWLKGIFSSTALTELIGCLELKVIVNDILHKGALRLHQAYTVAIFGGMLAILVKNKGIAETFIKYAAELGGDNRMMVALIMMLVSFLLFTTLGGLGAIIMVGTIILPIMMSLGISPLVAAGVFLIGLCAGGSFNPGNWALYETALEVERQDVQIFALLIIVLYLATGFVFITMNLMSGKRRRFRRYTDGGMPTTGSRKVHPIALLTPIIPIILVFQLSTFVKLFDYVKGKSALLDQFIFYFTKFATFWDKNIGAWDFIPAFLFGLVFCLVTTWEKRDNIKVLTRAAIEGAESVMPAVLLMFGIGMLLQAVRNPQVSSYLNPIVLKVIPSGPLGYIIGFGIFAPLALYRGPLNIWGLGFGIAGLFQQTGRISGPLIMGVFMSVGAIQGVCDPTNTHNVWIASFIKEDVFKITKKLLPYIWVMVFFGLAIAVILFHKGFASP